MEAFTSWTVRVPVDRGTPSLFAKGNRGGGGGVQFFLNYILKSNFTDGELAKAQSQG